MQRPIAMILAVAVFTGILGPLVLVAQDYNDNATSTDPVADDSATTTDNGTATTTDETDGNDAAGTTGTAVAEPLLTADPVAEAPKNEAETVKKTDPAVMAMWAMLETGLDDSPDPGSQILPTGILDADKKFRICAAVNPAAAAADSGFSVYTQFSYPRNAAFGPSDPAKRQGCGEAVSPICQMAPLEPAAGLELFCQKIKNNNENLPVFAGNGPGIIESYDYDTVCSELEKQTAAVYCGDQSLAYDDLSGDYTASVIAQNNEGIFSNLLLSKVQYLPITSVQIDFNSVNYGSVAANVGKTARYFSNDGNQNLGAAYIHNIGNTRIQISLLQDDMGLGKSGGSYNIRYNARYAIGNNKWIYYWPNDYAALPGEIDLSTSEAVELGVTVFKYPDTLADEFHGSLAVIASAADHYQCSD